jgi:hypothetical protein
MRDRDRIRADRDRAWGIATGIANSPRGTYSPANSIDMTNPQEAARTAGPTQAERDEKITKARAASKELADKAKLAHAEIRELCLNDPTYRPQNGRTRADYVPAEREDYPRQPSPPKKRTNRGETPNPFTFRYPHNRRRNRSSTRSRYEPPVDLTGQKGAYTPGNQRQDVGGGIDEFGTGFAHTTRRQRKEDALEEHREKRGEWGGEDVYEGIDPVFNRIVDWDTKGAEADLLAQADPGFLFENTEDREAREAAERERAEVDQEEAEETATAEAIHQEQSQGLSQTAVVENEGTC